MAASTSVGRKVTPTTAQLLGVEPNPPPVWTSMPGPGCPTRPGAGAAEGQSKTSAGRLGRAGLPNPFILG